MILVAMPEEIQLTNSNREDVVVTGVGALNVIKTLKNVDRKTPIINVGYAGSNTIKKGTWVKIGDVKTFHPNVTFDEPVFVLDGDTTCYTAGDFVTQTDIKEPCVFDMELAYILALGFTNVTSYKMVSDCLNINEFEDAINEDIYKRGNEKLPNYIQTQI